MCHSDLRLYLTDKFKPFIYWQNFQIIFVKVLFDPKANLRFRLILNFELNKSFIKYNKSFKNSFIERKISHQISVWLFLDSADCSPRGSTAHEYLGKQTSEWLPLSPEDLPNPIEPGSPKAQGRFLFILKSSWASVIRL